MYLPSHHMTYFNTDKPHQSSSQPLGRLNKHPGQLPGSDVPVSDSVVRNRLLNNNFSSNDSLTSLNPDQMLSYGAKQIISLFIPVTICMLFVVAVASTVDFYGHTDQYLIYTPFHTRMQTLVRKHGRQ
ncbi:unnamed protein product [Heterobilharzia americana]|nr:unnamed protein product [Heterobilharzia americana]